MIMSKDIQYHVFRQMTISAEKYFLVIRQELNTRTIIFIQYCQVRFQVWIKEMPAAVIKSFEGKMPVSFPGKPDCTGRYSFVF